MHEHDGHIVVVVCRYSSKMLIDVIPLEIPKTLF